MKWHNHKLLTGLTIFLATSDPLATVSSMIGSIFPDSIEGKTFNPKIHRTHSHWFVYYVTIATIISLYIMYTTKIMNIYNINIYKTIMHYGIGIINNKIVISLFILYFFIGCIFHILEDAVCGKIPLFNPNKKEFGIRLFVVGSIREYFFVACCIFIMFFIKKMNL